MIPMCNISGAKYGSKPVSLAGTMTFKRSLCCSGNHQRVELKASISYATVLMKPPDCQWSTYSGVC
jgi:hypothetical protein